MPLLGEWFLRVFGIRGVVARATGFFERANAPPRYAAWFDEQTRIEGFERALLSFTRTDALESYVQTYAALGPQPKLLIWGADDREIPRKQVELLRTTLSNLRYEEIEGAGHGVSVERQSEVNRYIESFMQTARP
jgi:pimeloyl-ACP methyl ester carboxylesterase